MDRATLLVSGMVAVALFTVACGGSADPNVTPSDPPASSSSTSSSVGPTSTPSSSSSSAISSSAAVQANDPPAPIKLSAVIDLAKVYFDADVPTWPTIGCANTQYGMLDNGEGTVYVCLLYQSTTSTSYVGVGYQYVQDSSGPYHAAVVCLGCNHGGSDLGVAAGGTTSEALDWSGSNYVGYGNAADGVIHALYWPNGGTPVILPMPAGINASTHAEAHGINSAGEIVGVYWVANSSQNVGTRAVLWEPDANTPDGSGFVAYDLTSLLPSNDSGLVLSTAYAIDCTGDVSVDGVPASWQSTASTAALHVHRYLVTRQDNNGANCTP